MSGDVYSGFRAAMLAALGHAPELIEPGRLHRFPTSERRSDCAGWCRLFADGRGGVFGCFRQGIARSWQSNDGSAWSPAQRAELARQFAEAAAARHREQRRAWEANARRNAALWQQCSPLVPGDVVCRYLARRGLAADVAPTTALRLHPDLAYWLDGECIGRCPAMVAPLVGPQGELLALHRTYLTQDGQKADVPMPRKLTGAAGPLAGACIPLAHADRGCIGIAEGIETALAAQSASGVPTVAAYSAGNLSAWQWPSGLRRIVIFADADRAGREAADALKARALAGGLWAEAIAPTTEGTDWCDVWADRHPYRLGNGGET